MIVTIGHGIINTHAYIVLLVMESNPKAITH